MKEAAPPADLGQSAVFSNQKIAIGEGCMRKISQSEDEAFEELCREIVLAAKASKDEIDAAVGSPFLYQRLRARIASKQKQGQKQGQRQRQRQGQRRATTGGWPAVFTRSLFGLLPIALPTWMRTSPWRSAAAVTAAAALAVLVMTAPRWLRTLSPEERQRGPGVSSTLTTASASQEQAPEKALSARQPETVTKNAPRHPPAPMRRAARRHHADEAEIATDYLPLTYVADSAAPESGLVMRVKVPRSTLVSLGVPMNLARADELVKADVVIGDDGLARAIRFVQ